MVNKRPDLQWNLLPWRKQQQQQQRYQIVKSMVVSAMSALILVLVLHIMLVIALHYQDEYNSDLHDQIKQLQPKAASAIQAQQMITQLSQQITQLTNMTKTRVQSLPLLTTLAKIMPDGIYFSQVSLQGQQVTIQGNAETLTQVNTLLENMRRYEIFINPTLQSSLPNDDNPPYRFLFTLHAMVN